MHCPECQKEVWDNRRENLKRKADGKKLRPEFSCKDKEGCGWVKWEEEKPKEKVEGGIDTKELLKAEDDSREKSMVLSYAKDLVCSELESGQKIEHPCDLTINYFTKLLKVFKHPLSLDEQV